MASGKIDLGHSKNIYGEIEWSSTTNISNNTSKVTAYIKVCKDASTSATTGTWKGFLTVGSKTKEFSYYDSVGSDWVWIDFDDGTGNISVNKTHANDGSGSIYIAGEINGPTGTTQSGAVVSGSKTVELDLIPREAKLLSAVNFKDTENPVITYDNPGGDSVTSLQAAIYSSDGETAYAAYRDITRTATSYTFSLTTAERNKLRNACNNANSMSVRFYLKTTVGTNVYTTYLTKTLSIVNANPTINPTITDTNSVTASLTGDSNTLIRYFSNTAITFGASALKGASIVSKKVTCGSASLTADGTINEVESGTFKFTVTDSRGNTTTKTVTKDIVNYVKLTCSFANVAFTTDGVIKFTLKGNYFDNTFGATSNLLILQYRYKERNGDFGEWVNTSPTINNNSYTFPVTLSGLDYRKNYVVEVKALDELRTIDIDREFSCVPVFGWSKDDFELNVPLIMPNNGRINATTTDGTILNAFQPANQNNNLVIGYGAYTNNIGATNLYGNDVNILTNTGLTVNDGNDVFSILGAMRAMFNVYELDCTVTAGSGYSNCSATAFLIGNNLRMYMTADRSANANTGDVSNETVMTIRVKHNGKIRNLYGAGFASATTGAPASFYSAAERFDDNNHNITVSLCGVSVADNSWSGYWCLPCTLNLSAY